MVALTFAVVVATIVLHGFTLAPLARVLGLRTAERPGILIVGGSRWATALAAKLKDIEIPVTIADANWNHLADARQAGLDTFYGDPLSEHSHHNLNTERYNALVAATDNDAYNALVCTDFGPDIGRNNVYEIGGQREQSDRRAMHFTIGGRQLFKPGLDFRELRERHNAGWTFQTTRLTDEFDREAYLTSRAEDARVILWRRPDGTLIFEAGSSGARVQEGDVILSFAPPRQADTPAGRKKKRAETADKEDS
jgi:hypothetical protein